MKATDSSRLQSLILICLLMLTFSLPIFAQFTNLATPRQSDKDAQAYAIFHEADELANPPNGKNDFRGTFQSKTAALQKYEEARHLYREIGDIRHEVFCLSSIGTIYLEFGEIKLAIDYFNQSLTILWVSSTMKVKNLLMILIYP